MDGNKESHEHMMLSLDPLGVGDAANLHVLQDFVKQEYEFKSPVSKSMKDFNPTFDRDNTMPPQQENGYDCGVFVCAYGYCLVNELPLNTFTQSNMNFFRQHIACSIASGSLLPLIKYPALFQN